MKKILLTSIAALSFCFTYDAIAAPLTLNFQNVSLVSFAQATYQSMLGADYVISPDVVSLEKKISISVKSIDSSKLPAFLENILSSQGIKVTLRDGVYYLDPVDHPAMDLSQPGQHDENGTHQAIAGKAQSGTFNPASLLPQLGKLPEPSTKPEVPTESRIFVPANRPAEMIVEAVNAGFGAKTAQLVGDRVLITASEKKIDKVFVLLTELDYQPKTVEVSASWVEVTHSTTAGLGISIAANLLGSKFAASLGNTNSGSQLSITGTNFQFVLDALNTDSRFKEVSNSRMLGDAGQKISFTVGDETPTISSTSTNSAGNPVQNVVYRPSGTITNVTPVVLGSGKIAITLDGEISSFQVTTTGVAGSPTLIKRQLKTVVTIGDGEVLLIGGLNDNQTTKSSSGWAFLPSSWASKQDSGTQTDLVLVLSAKVTNQVLEKPIL